MSGLLDAQEPLLWYVNRSTGLVLAVLLTLTVVLGLLAARRDPGPRAVPRFVPQAVHRGLGLLTVLLLAVHVGSAVVDEYVDIRWWHAFVPAGLSYRPVWLALGVLAGDLVLALVLTSLVRSRLRHRHWRAVHLAAYPAWGVALLHGVGIGTDTASAPVTWGYVACAGLVAAAATHRLVSGARHRVARRRAAHGLSSTYAQVPATTGAPR